MLLAQNMVQTSRPYTWKCVHGSRHTSASRKMHQPNMKVNPMATLDNPGPGSYNVAGRGLNTDGGVRFSTAFPMDDVEWVMLRASRLPAPNEYKPVPVQGKSPLSSVRSAPSLVFATAGRDARKNGISLVLHPMH